MRPAASLLLCSGPVIHGPASVYDDKRRSLRQRARALPSIDGPVSPSHSAVEASRAGSTEAKTLPLRLGLGGTAVVEHDAAASVLAQIESMGLTDTDLVSRPWHWFWVVCAVVALLNMLLRGIQVAGPGEGLSGIVSFLLAYILADFATGVYHFGVDNYGDASTPVFGPQIDAFQGHHKRPWTIANRQFANNLHLLARPVALVIIALSFLPLSLVQDIFLSTFFASVMFSQQFHAWAHTPKSHLPGVVVALQDAGILVGRKMHGTHHRKPFNCNYCIVSGLCNAPLDSLGFFEAMEKLIFRVTRIPPRSWLLGARMSSEMETQTSYYEDGADVLQ